MALEAARFQMSNDDAGYDKGLQDGWSEAIRSSGGRADVPMAKSGTSGPEYRKGLLKGFMEAAEEKVRSGGGGSSVSAMSSLCSLVSCVRPSRATAILTDIASSSSILTTSHSSISCLPKDSLNATHHLSTSIAATTPALHRSSEPPHPCDSTAPPLQPPSSMTSTPTGGAYRRPWSNS